MREVVSQQLWLGNVADVRDVRRLHHTGIRAVVDLAYEEPIPELTRDLLYCRFPLVDGSGNSAQTLLATIETTASLVRRRIPTLVACGVGMSRSPAIVAAALAILRGEKPDKCLQQLVVGKPHDVSPTLWADVLSAYNDLAG